MFNKTVCILLIISIAIFMIGTTEARPDFWSRLGKEVVSKLYFCNSTDFHCFLFIYSPGFNVEQTCHLGNRL